MKMDYQYITTQGHFARFLEEIENVSWIGYDTEFISEGHYRAELCLLQVATETGYYLLDTLSLPDLTPFWERVCRDDTLSIVHACRSELEFCFRAVKRFPKRIFDVQLAAAFVGLGYPLNFKSLANETIKVSLEKAETLTDWKHRPLLHSQLSYALNDVCHLRKITNYLIEKLHTMNRMEWFEEEMQDYCRELKESFTEEHWRKLVGARACSSNELTIIRDLWRWRREKALAKNVAPSRIMRDDVILNLAKRGVYAPEQIAVMRGVNGPSQSQFVQEICHVIRGTLETPEEEKPKQTVAFYPVYKLATQLVGVLLAQYCQKRHISYQIVTTLSDIRQAIAYYEHKIPDVRQVRLLSGWRTKFLGDFLNNVLSGHYAMQLNDRSLDERPLKLVDLRGSRSKAVHFDK